MTAPMTREELMPCPFCGGAAVVEEVPTGLGAGGVSFSVGCDSPDEVACMGYQNLQTFSRRSEAVAGWNRRGGVAQQLPGISDEELAGWARSWHWNDTAGDQPVDPSIYFRDMRMLKAFIEKCRSNQGASK